MSAGHIFQRGPNGEIPTGMSYNGREGVGEIPLHGEQPEHVTVYGPGWHRSWNNNVGGPGSSGDHSTIHSSGELIQHKPWTPNP